MGNLFSRSVNDLNKGNKRSLEPEEINGDYKRVRLESIVTEENVGIIAYVNPNLPGFHSILKYRAEDFLVNEVDMEKNIIHLTSLEAPNTKAKDQEIDILEPKKFDNQVANVMGEEFAVQFRQFLEKPEDKDAVLTVPADKDQRIKLYRLLENNLETKLYSRGKDGNMIIKWPTSTEYQEEYIDWNTIGGDYLQVHMYKSGIDTMNAINVISRTKDARAITTQTLSLKRIKPGRFVAAKEELMKSGIYIGDYKFVKNGLTLGDLGGNHFTIVLRDVKDITEAGLQTSLESLRDNGFLNYFGMQRFGTSTVLTHTIGCAIMKKRYEEASDLILCPREGEREDYNNARQLWKDTRNAEATLAIFPKRAMAERKLLMFYSRNPGQHANAIKNLPRHMLSLYSHAYQSYVWNRVVSERARLYGSHKPLVGDIVLVENEKKDASKRDSKRDRVGRRDFNNRKVPKVLTEEDVDNYSIEDVVYPLPGRLSVYPENEIKKLYVEIMAEDGISIDKKDKHFEGLNGDYRPLLAKPEQMSWSFIRYNDPVEKLCNTDIDRLHGLPEPTGVQDGQYLALKVEFTLGTSQYATMALREIMRAETSSQVQSTLSHH
ncbi:hypothetical protein G6F57_007998 [Rhizopus arrhizus]|uniref:TRUD domain-containing protein n=1 Tax=Rhizopus oryzae TaxID=64495 RepID=A0A9P6XA81_RHIOR|nr:hypothetical protein G6F23_005814 [Rhizopus arrhizus]KAG0761065.1 hypothetical protein G6F24_007841 [Rhizopus arrhizus]KAG0781504.1 hypothetical protein G6F22_009538 [Rhizopus arrhizus]KAG0794182.1 hypothetical protein G6F21_003058 [Rhizopus arrhizus]KAG0809600.1 hypothetical protein G6F20_008650 [Rhizopus arrhizus]